MRWLLRRCISPPCVRFVRYSREMMRMKAIKKIRSKNNVDGQSKEILSSSKQSSQTGTKKVSRVANLLKTLNNSAPKVFSIATLDLPVARS